MSLSASAQIRQSVSASYSTTAGGGATNAPSITFSDTLSTTDITKVYFNTVTSASPVTINLQSLTDVFGNSLNIATLHGVFVQNTSDTHALTIGGGSAAALGSDLATVGGGSCYFNTTAFTISGSAHNIVVTPSASLTYNILVLGA